MSGFYVVVYFGRDGRMLNIPCMYFCIIVCSPSVKPVIGSIKADTAERTILQHPTTA